MTTEGRRPAQQGPGRGARKAGSEPAGEERRRAAGGPSASRGHSARGEGGRGSGPRARASVAPGGRDGSRTRRTDKRSEPGIPEDVALQELDRDVIRDLRTLDKANAETVGRHLVMVGRLLDGDPEQALAHARAARSRAGRVAVVRETAGIAAYHAGEWAEALSELRAARRMSGGPGLVAVMADCERGLGRPQRAVELGRSPESRSLTGDEAIEMRIVVSGARMDLGNTDAAVVTLQGEELDPSRKDPAHARLFYAYAEALAAAGRMDESSEWFRHAAAADVHGDTDAEERAAYAPGEDLRPR